MDISISDIIVWVIVGILAGQLVGWLLTGKREGFGWFKNLAAGLVGGIVGGFLFVKLLDLDFGMSKISISLQDIVAAVLGALLVLLVLNIVRGKKKPTPAA